MKFENGANFIANNENKAQGIVNNIRVKKIKDISILYKILYNIYNIISEWLNYVKAYAAKHEISYKEALRDASPSY